MMSMGGQIQEVSKYQEEKKPKKDHGFPPELIKNKQDNNLRQFSKIEHFLGSARGWFPRAIPNGI